MTQTRAPAGSPPPGIPTGVSRVDEIDKRAEALRENLKKRKALAKAREQDRKNEDQN